MNKEAYLEEFIFKGLTNLNDGFDAESIKYFSQQDFETILNRIEEYGLGIYGIEPWKNGKFYDVINTPYSGEGGAVYKLSIMRDITDIRKKQQDLRVILNAIENSVNLISVCDLTGKILYSNNTQAEFFGRSRDDLIGMNISSLYDLNFELNEDVEVFNRLLT